MHFFKILRIFPLLLVCLSVLNKETSAAVSFTFSDLIAPFDSTTISAGDSFDVFANISTDENIEGISYLLRISGPGTNLFTITGRNITGAPYSEAQLTTSNSNLLNGTGGASPILAPSNSGDLGAFGFTAFTGNRTMALFTISTDNAIPVGEFTLSFSNASVNVGFDDIFPTTSNYTINVIPEPTTLLLASLGLTAMLIRRRRR